MSLCKSFVRQLGREGRGFIIISHHLNTHFLFSCLCCSAAVNTTYWLDALWLENPKQNVCSFSTAMSRPSFSTSPAALYSRCILPEIVYICFMLLPENNITWFTKMMHVTNSCDLNRELMLQKHFGRFCCIYFFNKSCLELQMTRVSEINPSMLVVSSRAPLTSIPTDATSL